MCCAALASDVGLVDSMAPCACAGEAKSPIPGVEGWNQTLASASEAVVRPPSQLLASNHHASSLSAESCALAFQTDASSFPTCSREVMLGATRKYTNFRHAGHCGRLAHVADSDATGVEPSMQVKAEREAPDDIDELQRMSVEHHAETHAEDRGVEAEELIDRSTRS